MNSPVSVNGPTRPSALGQPFAGSFALNGLFTIALIFLLKVAEPILLPILVAVIFTFLLSPMVRALRRRGIDDAIGAAIVVFGLLTVVGLLGSTLIGPATAWWERAPSNVQQLVDTADRVRRSIPLLTPPTQVEPRTSTRARAASAAPPAASSDPLKERITTEGIALTGTLLKKIGGVGLTAASIVILLYFLLASERWLIARTIEAIPQRRARVSVIGAVRAAQRDIAAFLATQALINLGVAVATGLAVAALGLPSPVLWGVVAGLLTFIPYLGPLLNFGLLMIAGALTFDEFGAVIAPALAFGAINIIESNFVSPWVVGRRLELSPLAVFLMIMVAGWLWGIAGAFIAVPFLVALRSACRRSRRMRPWCVYLDSGRTDPPSMRFLLGLRRRRRVVA